MDRTLDDQRQRNARSRYYWDDFAGHREKVTTLALGSLAPGGGRLCVLGAGNCNDLDLQRLLAACREIHLVDLDAEALAAGLELQNLAGHPALTLHGGVELSGVLGDLAGPPGEDRAGALIAGLGAAAPVLPAGPFDAVLSACVLTQMIEPVIAALGADHARLAEALGALRRAHLALMTGLTRPGGTAVLVSDLVSSDTVPGLAETPAGDLKDLMPRLVQAHNFFSGANPFALLDALEQDTGLRTQVDKVGLVEPWIWHLGSARSFLVYAIALRRRG